MLVREPERRRGVGAPAAEPGRDRDPLVDPHVPGRARRRRRRRARAAPLATSVSSAKPAHAQAVGRLEHERVGEVDPLQHGRDLVLAVRAARPDDEREVDLRRAPRARHATSPVSATNCSGRSASARSGARARARRARPRRARGSRRPASSSEFGKRLAPVRERALDDALDRRVVARERPPRERDERRVDVRARPEHRSRDGMEAGALGRELDEHRDRAVRLRPGLGEEAVGDLALHHHAPALDARAARPGSRRRSASRRCRAGWRRASPAADRALPRSSAQRVAVHDRRRSSAPVEPLGEPWLEPAVDLDGVTCATRSAR